ncbi:large subunit ribosomal protein L6 [Mycoplasmoides fastidiosum]|uniref:50S ribosomal protein L6 n=1 Tax=Mycoplasmoides fastidiosum TaxID=92758 RepID=A0ABU0LY34_9BACT|nr:50S ribosomal protein L6 [Mycoplasmoides fastidiosum]MDQ0513619.1 large subunit ribosomal protein L6 [Mycoplasmoides fastidiosum]UUD37958.1 50S ribosomal protein L6 [Mycoplasmoides fastidiosum]
MSRIGNRILAVPGNIKVLLDRNLITVTNGTDQVVMKYNEHLVKIHLTDSTVSTAKANSSKESRMQYGTINALIKNAIEGLSTGFSKTLKMTGVGYKAALVGDKLVLTLGFSHPIEIVIPAAIKVELVSPTELKISSFHKELLGEFAANIRKWRKPEPYKGKGIAYADEQILRKVGKTSEGGKGKK